MPNSCATCLRGFPELRQCSTAWRLKLSSKRRRFFSVGSGIFIVVPSYTPPCPLNRDNLIPCRAKLGDAGSLLRPLGFGPWTLDIAVKSCQIVLDRTTHKRPLRPRLPTPIRRAV